MEVKMERKLIADFVKENLAEERTGHDYYHGKRVAVLAERMLLADHPEAGQEPGYCLYGGLCPRHDR